MSIQLLIYWILVKVTLIVDCAPKIQNFIYDPLVFESSDSDLSLERIVPNFRKDISPGVIENDGYIFNKNLCMEINTRIHCGYDRNKGYKINEKESVDMGNGCRSRGDRIECGYEHGQFIKHLIHPTLKHGETNKLQGDNKHNFAVRQAPTRTSRTTTPAVNISIEDDFLENEILTSTNTLLVKPLHIEINESVVAKNESVVTNTVSIVTNTESLMTNTESVLELTSSTKTSSITGALKTTTVFETPKTLTTKTKSITSIKSTSTSELSQTESTSTVSSTETTSTQTTESSKSELDSSNKETSQKIEKVKLRNGQEKGPAQTSGRLAEMLMTLPKKTKEINTKSTVKVVSTTHGPIGYDCETSRRADLRTKTSSGEKTRTACVEVGDRVVCYDFKT